MIRRLTVHWPGPAALPDPKETIRLLAISDVDVPSLSNARNREQLGRVDLILGCGDLEPDYLAFVADAFPVPLLYVRGNHDFGSAWEAGRDRVPEPMAAACVTAFGGLRIAGLPWPGGRPDDRGLHEFAAWRQVLRLAVAARRWRDGGAIVISHMPPRGAGDDASDHYHTGFGAYRWLADRLRPPLWLHGHTPLAAAVPWHSKVDGTVYVNVTGAVLIELTPAPERSRAPGADPHAARPA